MRSLIQLPKLALKKYALYPQEFLAGIILRAAQEAQFPSEPFFDLELAVFTLLEQDLFSSLLFIKIEDNGW